MYMDTEEVNIVKIGSTLISIVLYNSNMKIIFHAL
jgi:hypothetical protein